MPIRASRLIIGALAVAACATAARAQPQLPTAIPQVRFNAGQDLQPYFEGWIKNPDGTFDLVFGYFNRNYQEELIIPAGSDNRIEPGTPDQGQPTYFLPRRQRWTFRLRVPADFGKKSVTWTVTAHGKTNKAYGELLPTQELTERIIMTNGGLDPGEDDPNQPPTISIMPATNATISAQLTELTLTAAVTDDGLPKPRVPAAPRPTTTTGNSAFGAQVNSSGTGGRPRGLNVSWMQLRGPAKAVFEPASGIPVVNGEAATHVRFTAPGRYQLVATASDGALARRVTITLDVPPARLNR